MASLYKIPKKKHPAGSDSTDLHMLSPLSRLQSSTPQLKSYSDQSSRGGANRVHSGNALSPIANRQKPLFRDVVKTLLGLHSPNTAGSSAANQSWDCQPQPGRRTESGSDCCSNGWRPKRASDRLLKDEVFSKSLSPPQKKKSSSSLNKNITVESVDSLAELRGEEHVRSLSLSPVGVRTWRRVESREVTVESDSPESFLKPQKKNSSLFGSDQTSEDNFVSPIGTRTKHPADTSSPSRPSSVKSVVTPRTTPDHRTLDRMSWLAARSNLTEDLREKERQRWTKFREQKPNRSAVLRLQLKKPRQIPAEPIVLSSEEEEEGEDDGAGVKRLSKSGNSSEMIQAQQSAKQVCSPRVIDTDRLQTTASFLHLEFSSLHIGLMHLEANGEMMISESGIILPLKAGSKDVEVSVVASQVRGYGVWDGGVVRGGALLADWEGLAPSLLFLWVSDTQANLLHRELSAVQTCSSVSGTPCSVLLLLLKEQLLELQAALLASILDMEEFRKGRDSSSGLTSPLDWTNGLLLLQSCPSPLDQHLLGLLGQCASSPVRSSQSASFRNSSGLQSFPQLSSRLIQYPPPPCKGRITVTKEDLACLRSGVFLNDVIIDFYLKFLLMEGVSGSVAGQSHVFSSFFYKQLSRRRASGEDDVPFVPDRHMRHQRVKTWTRHVDIFTKEFLFVPVNHEAHWFLVVVCFAGLEELQYKEVQSRSGGSTAGKTSAFSLRSQQQPECTQQGCQRDTVMKRPCILVMDSLKLSYHENVCRLLRDYLQVEWEVRRATPRLFTPDNMRSSNCRVPLQDNSSDCGLYLLQYVESFLQNPVVHFELPLRLDNWFPRQRVRQKRDEIRNLIIRMHHRQRGNEEN